MAIITIDTDKLHWCNMTGTQLGWVNEVDISNAIVTPARWIPVTERLPEEGKQYLCCDQNGFREVGYYGVTTHDWHFADNDYMDEVIAWMPLPEPYKAESEDKE